MKKPCGRCGFGHAAISGAEADALARQLLRGPSLQRPIENLSWGDQESLAAYVFHWALATIDAMAARSRVFVPADDLAAEVLKSIFVRDPDQPASPRIFLFDPPRGKFSTYLRMLAVTRARKYIGHEGRRADRLHAA